MLVDCVGVAVEVGNEVLVRGAYDPRDNGRWQVWQYYIGGEAVALSRTFEGHDQYQRWPLQVLILDDDVAYEAAVAHNRNSATIEVIPINQWPQGAREEINYET
jgi:hypothetical protein